MVFEDAACCWRCVGQEEGCRRAQGGNEAGKLGRISGQWQEGEKAGRGGGAEERRSPLGGGHKANRHWK